MYEAVIEGVETGRLVDDLSVAGVGLDAFELQQDSAKR